MASRTRMIASVIAMFGVVGAASAQCHELLANVPIGFVSDFALSNDTLYVCADETAVHTYDVSDPSAPKPLGEVAVDAIVIKVVGDLAYVAGGINLSVLDVSDPASPTVVWSERALSFASGIEANGNLLVVGFDCDQVRIYDISAPAAPQLLNTFMVGGCRSVSADIVVKDDLAFLAQTSSGFAIYDISDPMQRVPLGGVHLGNDRNAFAITLRGSTAYVAWHHYHVEQGMDIIDVSNPSAPVRLGSYAFSGGTVPGKPHIIGDTAVLTHDDGLEVVDISDPRNPSLVQSHTFNIGSGRGLWAGNILYSGFPVQPEPGVVIHDLNECLPCYADCDGSGGTLDIFDFLCFQDAFVAGDPYADCDVNGAFDILDFLCYQDAFTAACP